MNKIQSLLFVAVVLMAGLPACHYADKVPEPDLSKIKDSNDLIEPGQDYLYHSNGKVKEAPALQELYTKSSLENLNDPVMTKQLVVGLKRQLRVLRNSRRKNAYQLGELEVQIDVLEKSIRTILDVAEKDPEMLSKFVDAYQLKGADNKGNVKFTGYYTPVLKIKSEPDAVYKYPIYTRPKGWEGKLPSREAIDGDMVLNGMGLELGYAANLVDIYFMQVQGSGIVEYENGTQVLLANNGANGYGYSSIGRYLVKKEYMPKSHVSMKGIRNFLNRNPQLLEEVLFTNRSYVFFTPKKSKPIGAGMVQLIKDYSIAVDKRYIPMGSCLLSRVPVVKSNKVVDHEYRILLAQDVGGAIKGPGHVDLYLGVGSTAQRKASALHHYGNLWLLLPKEDKTLALAN